MLKLINQHIFIDSTGGFQMFSRNSAILKQIIRYLTHAIIILVFFLSLVGSQFPVHAASTHTVNSSSEGSDSNSSDGICDIGGGICTLRAAIEQANYNNGSDTITFADSYTISPIFPLPALSDTTGGTTIKRVGLYVSIDGTNAGATADGFVLSSNGNKIQNLNILNFGGNGIKITGNQNIIGMDSDGSNDAQEYNQIHSNGGNGIYVSGQRNRIAGNYIGYDKKANAQNGIEIANTQNVIGVNDDGVSDNIEGNTITKNTQDGIFVHGGQTIIAGNTITNNGEHGVLISLSGEDRVGTDGDGTSDARESNRISGNTKDGIHVYDSDNTVIAGNMIGVSPSGDAAHANGDYGIYLESSNITLIGTDGSGTGAANEGNLISGNLDGQIYAKFTLLTTIAGNKIGTDINGTAALSVSQGSGVKLENSESSAISLSRIGTDSNGQGDALEGNLISGTGWYGIRVYYSDSNTIQGNIIGLDITGLIPLPNEGNGIELVNADQNEVDQNAISGNQENGIFLSGAINNRIRGNLIGTNVNGTLAVGNQLNGVLITHSRLNIIGTESSGSYTDSETNLISGNLNSGIKIENTSPIDTNQNGIYGNRIGTSADGQGAIPNAYFGINLKGDRVSDNTIQANLIAHNLNSAVYLEGIQPTEGNTITRNNIVNNWGGIVIQGAGSNDLKDLDDGPNGLQNYPELQAALKDGMDIGISLNFNSTKSTNFNLHFYLTRSCRLYQYDTNQGEAYIGTFAISTDANGDKLPGTVSVTISSQDLTKGPYLLATATDTAGSTSEFSNCIYVEGLFYYLYLPLIIR